MPDERSEQESSGNLSLRLEIGDLWIDPPDSRIASLPAAFTYIDADVRIFIDDRLFFDEAICVVEMAGVLARWLGSADRPSKSLRFESADCEEQPTLLLELDGPRVTISSVSQRFTAQSAPLALDQVIAELKRFLPEVIERCRSDLSVDVTPWIALEH